MYKGGHICESVGMIRGKLLGTDTGMVMQDRKRDIFFVLHFWYRRSRINFLFIAEKPGLRFCPAAARMKSKEQNTSGQGRHRPDIKKGQEMCE